MTTTSTFGGAVLLPSESTVDAFVRVRALYEAHRSEWNYDRNPQSIRGMQQYLLTPTEESWACVVDQLRRHRATVWLTSSSRSHANVKEPLGKEEQCHNFEQKNNRKLSKKEETRLGALIMVAAVLAPRLGGMFSPDWGKDLLPAGSSNDQSGNISWGQAFFSSASTKTLLKKVYQGS